MKTRRAADLLVECLEAEGVRWVFGIPGEETLDINEALEDSSVTFVPVRHEQAGAFMADVYGRLTGRAGVCLGTLGPGATNLVTGVADAFLDRAPLVSLTGQSGLERMHKESHQYINVVALMAPITKWNARVTDPDIVPEAVRKAFKVAEAEKPGSTHLELPEDVIAAETEGRPLPAGPTVRPRPGTDDLERAAAILGEARHCVVLAGNGVVRGKAWAALRHFSATSGIPVAETFMAKGVLDYQDPQALGAVGLQAGDYEMAGFGQADVVLAIGYDLVEHAPKSWNPGGDKRIICIDSLPAEIDEHFVPEIELVGDIAFSLEWLSDRTRPVPAPPGCRRLRDVVSQRRTAASDDDAFPMQPPRILDELRRVLGPHDILVSDVGLHKLWIGRMYPAHEPNTVLIANGLAGMGFAVPAAIAAKLVHPERKVVAVSGDGGFLMNVQELETATRLGTAFVNVVWENRQFGSIVWKQERRFGRHFGTDFTNPDFVTLAASFGLPAWRATSADDFANRLSHAVTLETPSLIVVPVDYSVDVAIAEELGDVTTPT
ncbi:MAG TPA: acetolactate synthase large subunit [Acidimicrobiales bacterium]|nr:acetolactate synthase large subunit [Acidimicrobiales bacterium]